ncbi:MAG: hypothetical protein J1F66_02565 [Clostridiales bacterium]|nr:hypothetical protein [Clostridiales bacterium]
MRQDLLFDNRYINEEVEKLNRDVRRVGKIVSGFVKFLVAFFLFILLDVCIVLFSKHAGLLFLHNFRLLEEGLRVFVSENLLTFFSVIADNNLITAIAMSFACVFGVSYIAYTFTTASRESEGNEQVKEFKQFKQESVNAPCVVSYKQKVCFLS